MSCFMKTNVVTTISLGDVDRRINRVEVRSIIDLKSNYCPVHLPSNMSCLMVSKCYFMVLGMTYGQTTLERNKLAADITAHLSLFKCTYDFGNCCTS